MTVRPNSNQNGLTSYKDRPVPCHVPVRDCRGFTLLELLVTLSVLVSLVVIGVTVFRGSDDVAESRMINAEIRQVAAAVERFRQDTGYYPKTGPFAVAGSGSGQVPVSATEPPQSPANLSQLIEAPINASSAEIMPWNTETGRGWRGPYLTTFGEGTVTFGDGFSVDGDQTTSPLDGTARRVPGIADPFERRPEGAFFVWQEPTSARNVELRGRPYLYFIDPASGAPGNVVGCAVPCLVSLGPDGEYDGGGGDDIVLNF